jgi:hypothetical protein
MKKYFRFIAHFARIIPAPSWSHLTFYRHEEMKYLYYCISETHLTPENGERKMFELFPKAIRISQFEFDILIYFFPEVEVIQIADERIEDELKEDDGAYADDEHEETEDKKLIEAADDPDNFPDDLPKSQRP